ncbi:hypothetical protein V8G54_009588 [Vigna mungo]|uniref:Patatin n=1 Tax=Vigna mungo TaxID=3915 RepID=A0AAQ3S5L9_VIGMU
MAHLLFFVLIFAGQLIGGFSAQKQHPSNNGKLITILSIDGGGIKAIIPATILDYLDKALKAKDPKADLADYFDVMGGTSTGSITTAMLATPSLDHPTRPAYTPAQIVDFYKQNGPRIFNQSSYKLEKSQVAVSEVLQQNEDPEILVLSLGTGATKIEENFDARLAGTWQQPIWTVIDPQFQGRAYTAITEYYFYSLFSGFQSHNTYLRVQVNFYYVLHCD